MRTDDTHASPSPAPYTVSVTDDGILSLRIDGVLDAADVEGFFAALTPVHARIRRTTGTVRALLETTRVQSPVIAMQIRSRTMALADPADRVGIVFATILAKFQIQRLIGGEMFAIFTDRNAALAWLRRG